MYCFILSKWLMNYVGGLMHTLNTQTVILKHTQTHNYISVTHSLSHSHSHSPFHFHAAIHAILSQLKSSIQPGGRTPSSPPPTSAKPIFCSRHLSLFEINLIVTPSVRG